jgi:histone acetyltransferase 1
MAQVESLGSLEAVSGGFTDTMATEANKKLKICRRQTRRVYEILRLHFAVKVGGMSDKNEAYKDYRVDVKKRLNVPFQQEERKLAKLKKALKPEEYTAATLTITNREQRLESLQSQYKELEEHYLHVLERISVY